MTYNLVFVSCVAFFCVKFLQAQALGEDALKAHCHCVYEKYQKMALDEYNVEHKKNAPRKKDKAVVRKRREMIVLRTRKKQLNNPKRRRESRVSRCFRL